MTLDVVPLRFKQAKAYVAAYHSHNGNALPAGWLFGVQVLSDGETAGVGMCGRPSSGSLDNGRQVEITRVCTLGLRNACSMIYARLCRAAAALGNERAYTYTLRSECAACVRAAGFVLDAELDERGGWDTLARPRVEVDLFGNERTPPRSQEPLGA